MSLVTKRRSVIRSSSRPRPRGSETQPRQPARRQRSDRQRRRALIVPAHFCAAIRRVRRTVKTAAITIGSALAAAAIERLFFAAPRWRGAKSDHFDGERFHNRERARQTEGSFLKWQATREAGAWPEHPETTYGPPPPERVDDGRLRITFINHSTTLIQTDGVNILTDPVWSERV